jgi:hypothetical protein
MLIDTKKIDFIALFALLYVAAITAFAGWYAHTDLTLKKEQVIATRKLVEVQALQTEIIGLLAEVVIKPHGAPPVVDEDGAIEPAPGRGKTSAL